MQDELHYASLSELARLLEDAGQAAEAEENYRAYLDRWGNADIPIANADDARRRLQALTRM